MALFYLVNYSDWDGFPFEMDASLAYLAAAIKGAGHECRVFDSNPFTWNEEEFIRLAEKSKPDIIGFKIGSYLTMSSSAALAGAARKVSPSSIMVAGGPHATICGESIFSVTGAFDVIAAGEGDRTVVELAEYAEGKRSLADVRNIIYKDAESGAVVKTPTKVIGDLEELPMPDWSVFDMEKYFPVLAVSMQRGCPHRCTFCVSEHMWGRVRKRPLGHIIREIDYMAGRYGVSSFYITDPTPDTGLIEGLSSHIIGNNLPLKWYGYGHVATFKNLDFARIASAGCKALLFGIESGDEDVLKLIGKGFSVSDVTPLFKKARESGIKVVAFIICGFPGESENSVLKSLELIAESSPDEYSAEAFFLQPHSAIAEDPSRYGIKLDTDFEKNYAIGYENCWSIAGTAGEIRQSCYWDRFNKSRKNYTLPPFDISVHICGVLAPLVDMKTEEFYGYWKSIWNAKPDFAAIKALIGRCWSGTRALPRPSPE